MTSYNDIINNIMNVNSFNKYFIGLFCVNFNKCIFNNGDTNNVTSYEVATPGYYFSYYGDDEIKTQFSNHMFESINEWNMSAPIFFRMFKQIFWKWKRYGVRI